MTIPVGGGSAHLRAARYLAGSNWQRRTEQIADRRFILSRQEALTMEAPMSEGKVALITAGGSGMGAAAARKLAEDGYRVAVLSSSGKGEALAKQLGGVGVTGSNQSSDDVKRLVDLAMGTWGRIDGLVNSAGHGPRAPLLDIPDADWHKGMEVYFLSAVRSIRLVTPIMPHHMRRHAEPGGDFFRAEPAFLGQFLERFELIGRMHVLARDIFIKTDFKGVVGGVDDAADRLRFLDLLALDAEKLRQSACASDDDRNKILMPEIGSSGLMSAAQRV
jgi:short chain dehydrogenase